MDSRHFTIIGDSITINGIQFRSGTTLFASVPPPERRPRLCSRHGRFAGRLHTQHRRGRRPPNSWFINCTASSGGDIHVLSPSGRTILAALLLANNSAAITGGALHISATSADLHNSTLSHNFARAGGTVHLDGRGDAPGGATLSARAVAPLANRAVDGGAILASGRAALAVAAAAALRGNRASARGGAIRAAGPECACAGGASPSNN
jgi:hypothetical protein